MGVLTKNNTVSEENRCEEKICFVEFSDLKVGKVRKGLTFYFCKNEFKSCCKREKNPYGSFSKLGF